MRRAHIDSPCPSAFHGEGTQKDTHMLFRIDGLLDAAEVARIREVLKTANFADGRATAGEAVRAVKRNLQVAEQEEGLASCRKSINTALMQHEGFAMRVLPMRLLP